MGKCSGLRFKNVRSMPIYESGTAAFMPAVPEDLLIVCEDYREIVTVRIVHCYFRSLSSTFPAC